jgi:hypothetical protein
VPPPQLTGDHRKVQEAAATTMRRQDIFDVCDEYGYCRRHPDMRLMKPRDDGKHWRILRRRCPECIFDDRPPKLDVATVAVVVDEPEQRLTAQLRMEMQVEEETPHECLGRCLSEITITGVLVLLVVAIVSTIIYLL